MNKEKLGNMLVKIGLGIFALCILLAIVAGIIQVIIMHPLFLIPIIAVGCIVVGMILKPVDPDHFSDL